MEDLETVEAIEVVEEVRERVPLWERGRSSSEISWRDGEVSKPENCRSCSGSVEADGVGWGPPAWPQGRLEVD